MAAQTTRAAAGRPGGDRITVALCALAAFLAVLAVLAWQVRASPVAPGSTAVVVRRVYETRIVETVRGSRGGGSSITQSVSASGAPTPLAAPATRPSR